MALIFDASSKRIILDSSSVTATEIYSRSCDWLLASDNLKYGDVVLQVGGDDLGGGLSIPPYLFLRNGWRVRPMESSHNLTITGNLFVEGGGVPVVSTLGTYQVNVNYTVPVQAQGISTTGAASPWTETIEGSYTAAEILRLLASIAAGKTLIVDNGNGNAHVEFRNLSDTKVLLAATMNGSQRTAITTDLTTDLTSNIWTVAVTEATTATDTPDSVLLVASSWSAGFSSGFGG